MTVNVGRVSYFTIVFHQRCDVGCCTYSIVVFIMTVNVGCVFYCFVLSECDVGCFNFSTVVFNHDCECWSCFIMLCFITIVMLGVLNILLFRVVQHKDIILIHKSASVSA